MGQKMDKETQEPKKEQSEIDERKKQQQHHHLNHPLIEPLVDHPLIEQLVEQHLDRQLEHLINHHQLMKQSMIDTLQQTKASGSTLKLSFESIAFTGSARAGKTSFLNLLNKRKFKPHHHSTGVVESEHVVTVKQAGVVGSSEDSKWIELNHQNMLKQLYKHLCNVSLTKNTKESTMKKTMSLPNLQDPSIIPIVTASKVSSKTMSLINLRSPPSNLNIKKNNLCAVEGDIASVYRTYEEPSLGKVWNIINLLDTGGQPEFVNLLPTVSSSISLTFIVLNMEGGVKALDKPVLVVHSEHGKQSFEPHPIGLTNLDLVKMLMASSKNSGLRTSLPIQPSYKGVESDNTYQCYVGTHADKVSENEIKEIESKLDSVALELKCRKYLWEQDENVLFTVDNTTAGGDSEDHNAKSVRSRIQNLVGERNVYDVPITWLILLLELQKLSAERKVSFILYNEVQYICTQANLCQDIREVQYALLFFHIMGILLYYHDVPGMCKYVIVDHQWLFNKLTSLVKVSFPRSGFDQEVISQFKHEGLFNKSLIHQIRLEKDIDTECFIYLLIYLKICVPINQEKYFMPCVLPSYDFQQSGCSILDEYGHLQSEQLCIQFSHCPLPQGFFCCLVVEVFQHLPENWRLPLQSTKRRHHTYSNLISFHTSDTGHSVSLIDRIGYLEIQIRHEEDTLPIHNEVREILLRALDSVCNRLQYENKRLEFGYLCRNDKHTSENHLAILQNTDTSTEWIYCNHGKMKLTPSHKVWFQQYPVTQPHPSNLPPPTNTIAAGWGGAPLERVHFSNFPSVGVWHGMPPAHMVRTQQPTMNQPMRMEQDISPKRMRLDQLAAMDTTQTAAVQQGTLFMKMKQRELLPDDVMSKWEDLGLQLDFTADQLDTISNNHEKAVGTCCREMLKKWSRQYTLPSPQAAKQLIAAIHKAHNNYYAEQLKTEIEGGQEFSQRYLLTTVAEQIACDWRDVGIYLGVNVDNIEKEHNATKAKFEEMMSSWLRNQTDPEPVIYDKLYKALKAADQTAAAEKFKEKVEMQINIT